MMRKIFKLIGLASLSLLGFIILAGLIFLLLTPAPQPPQGKLVDVGGYKLHIVGEGEKGNSPTLVIEGGAGLPTEFTYWLNEGLKDRVRVIRYDRAGIGHSDKCVTPRDPETIARELHRLLEAAGESPPYIMMGHSLGGPYIRVFTELYPDEVRGMFFLDATHPDHVVRYNVMKESDVKFKVFLWSIELQAILSDLGIMSLVDKVWGTPYRGEGLPEEINDRFKEHLRNGKTFRAFKEEIRYYHTTLKRSGELEDFGDLPIRAVSAVSEDPTTRQLAAEKAQNTPKRGTHKEYFELSSNGKHIQIPGDQTQLRSLQK
ncbi:MAG: alpha/beta hydrolase [Bacteroidota bacterium]